MGSNNWFCFCPEMSGVGHANRDLQVNVCIEGEVS